MIAYKLFRVRTDRSLGSLFIGRKDRLPLNTWLPSRSIQTKGYKFRPFWHSTHAPEAPHLSEKGRKWYRVEIEDFIEMERPKSQGGKWHLSTLIKILEPV